LRTMEHEKLRLEKELDIARQVQQNLFPKTLPSAPGWDFAAVCRPAREVGGDYYDLFRVGSDEIAFALGDVSGKGLGPSLLMSNVQAMLRTGLRQTSTDIPRLASDLNEHLFSSSSAEMFVTVFIGVLDVRTGRLRYVNAGHNPPLVVTEKGRKRATLETGGIIVGAVPGMRFDQGEVVVEPGDMVVVYSDGVTEAMNPSGEMFGDDRLNEEACRAPTSGAPGVLTGILGSVDRFAANAEQADDISLIVIRRGP
jgi:phosphoserine phosphatase RsbU/P